MEKNNKSESPLGFENIVKITAFVLFLLVGGVLVAQLTPIIFPPQASLESQNVDNLFTILLFLGGIVFFLIQGLLVISVIAFRAKPGDTSDGAPHHGNMTLEIVWTIVPALIVIVLAVLSFDVWTRNTEVKADENLINGANVPINVVGARYAWSISYATDETVPETGEPAVISTGNKLHTYVGQNVHLRMQTQDVIHSFWVPAMRVKQDLLPGDPDEGGRPTDLRFTPVLIEGEQYPAEYPIVCAELCGDGHGRMTGVVVVYENEEQFLDMWYNEALDGVLFPPADPVLRGEGVIQTYACQGCHALESLGWEGITGPSLDGIADRAGERVPGQSAEEYLVTSLWNSGAYLVPGYQNLMPVFGPEAPGANHMTAEQLYSIVAFLCTQGESSDCDIENNTEVIPAAIEGMFGVPVDVNFGGAGAEATAEPGAESTAEATDEPGAEMTAEATAEATQEAED